MFRGSNSPIEAIISPHDADDHPQKAPGNPDEWKDVTVQHSDRDRSKSMAEICLWVFTCGAAEAGEEEIVWRGGSECGGGGGWGGETDGRREAESWEADLKFIQLLCRVRRAATLRSQGLSRRWFGKEESAARRWLLAAATGRCSSFCHHQALVNFFVPHYFVSHYFVMHSRLYSCERHVLTSLVFTQTPDLFRCFLSSGFPFCAKIYLAIYAWQQ